jgi:uncharacterized membrane protein
VLLGVDVATIVELGRSHGLVIRQVARIGDYTPEGAPLFEILGGTTSATSLASLIDLGRERTLYQDPLYGIRQLADTAVQALSPAINAPTTAVQVIDRLVDLVERIGRLPSPTGYVADGDGVVRFVYPVASWADVVALAFTEIRLYGGATAQVTRRLMAAFDQLTLVLPADRHAEIDAHRAALVEDVSRRIADDATRRLALQADSMGLG